MSPIARVFVSVCLSRKTCMNISVFFRRRLICSVALLYSISSVVVCFGFCVQLLLNISIIACTLNFIGSRASGKPARLDPLIADGDVRQGFICSVAYGVNF